MQEQEEINSKQELKLNKKQQQQQKKQEQEQESDPRIAAIQTDTRDSTKS